MLVYVIIDSSKPILTTRCILVCGRPLSCSELANFSFTSAILLSLCVTLPSQCSMCVFMYVWLCMIYRPSWTFTITGTAESVWAIHHLKRSFMQEVNTSVCLPEITNWTLYDRILCFKSWVFFKVSTMNIYPTMHSISMHLWFLHQLWCCQLLNLVSVVLTTCAAPNWPKCRLK